MTMINDILIITKEEFIKIKNTSTIQPSPKLQTLYDNLFSNYACFSKSDNGFHQVSHYNTKYNNKSHHHKHSKTFYPSTNIKFKRTIINDTQSEMNRKLKGLLNIINKNNHKRVTSKIKNLMTRDNAKIVYENILINTYNQVYYIHVFIELFEELNDYFEESRDECMNVVNTFIETFIFNKEYIYDMNKYDTLHDYELFCDQQKHKHIATSKNLVITEFLKKHFSDKWTIQMYVNHLVHTLHEYEKIDEMDCEINVDIILTLLKDLKNIDKTVKIDTIPISCLLRKNYCQRVQFIIQDIINLEWS